MTEAEWLTSCDPAAMLRHLTHERVHAAGVGTTEIPRSAPLASARKLRLFASECVRIAYDDSVKDRPEQPPNGWTALQWADRWVDPNHLPQTEPPHAYRAALLRDIFGNPFRRFVPGPEYATLNIAGGVPIDWLTWNDGLIPKLASTIYDERAFDRMPILADALEEAGCTNGDILQHCRNIPYRLNTGPGDYGDEWLTVDAGPHVRGCWVIDLLLGKG